MPEAYQPKPMPKRKPTELETSLHASSIPRYMHGGIIRWIEEGVPPGDFLSAITANDLRGAFKRADDTNILLIRDYLAWFYNHAPYLCWGYPKALKTWRGMLGEVSKTRASAPIDTEDDL